MKKKRVYINDKIKCKIIESQNFCCNKCKKLANGYVLQLHHKNHDPCDNSIKNLEALCWNCHRKETIESNRAKMIALKLPRSI